MNRFSTLFVVAPLAVSTLLAGCGGGAGTRAAPDLTAPPTHVRWSPYQGVQLPNADQGPTKTDTGAALGFARVPAGAALAAVVHAVHVGIAPDDQWAKIVAAEVEPGPARDDYATSRAQMSVTGVADPATAPRVRGYRIDHYTDTLADVTVYTSVSDTSISANHETVAWSAADWRLRLPDPGSTAPRVEPVATVPTDMVRLEAPIHG